MSLNAYDDTLEELDPPQEQAPANPYLDALDARGEVQQRTLQTSLQQAQTTTPDRAAEARKLADQTGVAYEIVQRNLDAIKRRVAVEDSPAAQLLRESPHVAAWASDPQNAAVAHDDLPSLSAIETALRHGRKAAGSLGAGVLGFAQGAYGALQAGAEIEQGIADTVAGARNVIQNPWQSLLRFSYWAVGKGTPDQPSGVAKFATQAAAEAGAEATMLRGDQSGAGFVERSIYGGIESVGQMVPSLVLGLVLGPEATLAAVGATTGGQTYSGARAEGLNVAESAVVGSIQGAVEVATEFIPAHRLLGDVAAKLPLWQTLARQMAAEIPGEEVATVLQDLNEWAFLPANKDRTFGDYLKERPSAAAATLISVVVGTGLQTVATHGTVRMVEKLGETVEQSATAKRSPEAVESFVTQAVKDGGGPETLYQPIDTWREYWQSKGVDPAQAATDVLGSRQAYDEAVRLGTDLAIPTARYAVALAGTEHNAFFAQELRPAPDVMNGREAAEFEAEQAKAIPATGEEAGKRRGTSGDQAGEGGDSTPAQQVRAQVVEQLTGAGVERSTAETYATLYESAFGAMAQRAGLDPAALYARYGLTVQRPDLTASTPASEASKSPDLSSEAPLTEAAQTELGQPALDPNEPIAAMDNISAAAMRMIAENPRIVKEAEALRARALASRAPAPPRDFAELFQSPKKAELIARRAAVEPALRAQHAAEIAPVKAQYFADLAALYAEAGLTLPAALVSGTRVLTDAQADRLIAHGISADRIPTDWTEDVHEHFKDWVERAANEDNAEAIQWFDATYGEGTEFSQDKRGSIRFGADRQMSITLFEHADLSTFIHESAHLFSEVLTDLAATADASDQIKADFAALKAAYPDESAPAVKFSEQQHESIARAFEAYLMEGKAPSVELRSAFSRMRAWLLGVYRALANLNVRLQPDVRAVFDRMLATDHAIAEAQASGLVTPIFTTSESAGMTPEQFELYRETIAAAHRTATERLDRKLMTEVQRQQSEQYAAQRALVETDVTAEVHGRREYRALAAMQKGTHPDGTSLNDGGEAEPLKLSKAIIVERYGKDRLKELPRPYIYSVEVGYDPDTVAELFGFSSGDEMLAAVSVAPPMKATIQAETDRRMAAEHPSILLDGSIHERAQEALANEDAEVVIRAELAALAKLERTVEPHVRAERKATLEGLQAVRAAIPPEDLLRAQARAMVAGTRVRDLKPQTYWVAGRRAARLAIEHISRQDYPAAIAAKQQELLNLALYRESLRAKEEKLADARWARDQAKPAARGRIGKANENWLDQIDGFLDRYEFAAVPQKALDRRGSLRKFLAALEGDGLPVPEDIPDAVLDATQRVNWQELTVEEMTGVIDAMRQIVHLARLKNKLLKSADKRDFDEVRDGLAGSILEHTAAKQTKLEIRPADEKVRKVKAWFASHAKIARLARAIDGHKDGGAMWEGIIRPLNAAADTEETRFKDAGAAYSAILEQHYPGRELGKLNVKTFIPAINDSLSKEGRLAVALNWGNQTSRDRILADPRRNWTPQQAQAVLDTLDANDWAFVQATWDYLGTFWPEIAAKQKRLTGIAPERVEAAEVVTRFGVFRGGYYPLAYDGRLHPRAAHHQAVSEAKLAVAGAATAATTRRGHTIARVENVTLPVRLDLGVAFQHLQQVIHDLTHHETLIDTTRLLRDEKVSQAIFDTRGDLVYKQFTSALEDIALGSTSGGGKPHGTDAAVNYMRTGTQIAGLGLNLWTALQQPVGLFNGMSRVGPVWVARGMKRWLRDAASLENTLAWITDVSPMMRNRGTTATQDLHDLRAQLQKPGGWFDGLVRTVSGDRLTRQTITDGFLWHIGLAQRVADVPTWLGAYEKAMANNEPEARAFALADQAVLDSQGGGQIKDMAAIQRGSPPAKLFMTFYSYGNMLGNATAERYGATNFRSAASIVAFMGHLSLLYVMPALASVALSRALGKSGGDDDDEEKFLADVGGEMLSTALNTMVLVREGQGLAAMLLHKGSGGSRGYEGPAGTRLIELAYRAGQQLHQGDADAALVRSLNALGGVLFHYPAAQVQRTVDGFVALDEGRTSNPVALLVGAPPKNK